MNYSEKLELLKAHAQKQQHNAHCMWLVRQRIAELQRKISKNNPVLASGRKIISEKMDALRTEQTHNIQSLNFFNSALLDLETEKQILWQEFDTKF